MLDFAQNENAVAGAILIDPSCLTDVSAVLTADDFAYPAPRIVFKAAQTLSGDGKAVDPVTIQAVANDAGDPLEVRWVIDCMNATPTAANVLEYARLVKADARRRKLAEIAEEIQGSVADHQPPQEVTEKVYSMLDELNPSAGTGLTTTPEALTDFFAYREKVDEGGANVIVKTGYSDLDRVLGGGLKNGGVYIIGARPGVGKTTAAVCILENMAAAGMNSLFISLEMSRDELTAKRLSRQSGVTYSKLMFGRLDSDEYGKVHTAASRLYGNGIMFTTKPIMTVNDIALAARRVKNLRCLCIDHFSLIMPANRKGDNRVTQYTEISNDIKRLAKTLDVPIILLAQLNRQNEQRANKKPILSDLRETGAAEQDADAVIFLHRPRLYEDDSSPDEKRSEWESEPIDFIVAKNRHARTGTVNMLFFGATGNIHGTVNSYS